MARPVRSRPVKASKLGSGTPYRGHMPWSAKPEASRLRRARKSSPGPITIGTIFQFRQRWSGRESFMAAPALQRSFGRSADFSQEAIKTREQKGYDETKKVLVGATSPIADEECAVLLGRIPRSGSGVADAAC
jgi:hypothetical protein